MKEKSLAMEMLEDYKKANARQFVIILVILGLWALTIGYLVYILNDIGYIDEETRTQEIDTSSIEYSDIINGDYYGED